MMWFGSASGTRRRSWLVGHGPFEENDLEVKFEEHMFVAIVVDGVLERTAGPEP
jgi:hypothetical protein